MNAPYTSSYDASEIDATGAPAARRPLEPARPATHARPAKHGLKLALAVAAAAAAWAIGRAWTSPAPLHWSGTVEAHTVSVGLRVGGRVHQVLVHEGQPVTAGQALVRFERGDLEWKRVVAEARLEEARAVLEKLQNGPRPQERDQVDEQARAAAAAFRQSVTGATPASRAAARARLAAAEAEVDKRERDAQRAHELAGSGAISDAEVAAAEAALSVALAEGAMRAHEYEEIERGTRPELVAQAGARSREAAAQAQLLRAGTRAEDLRAARARVQAAEAQLRGELAALDELTVRAPCAARVEAIAIRPGDLSAAGEPVVKLLEVDQVYVRMYVPETQLGRVRVGQDVLISVDSFPERAIPGRIDQISGMGEFSPRNLQTVDERANQVFAARVSLQGGRDLLRPGMAASVRARP